LSLKQAAPSCKILAKLSQLVLNKAVLFFSFTLVTGPRKSLSLNLLQLVLNKAVSSHLLLSSLLLE